ncbi:RDD family protein [Guyparkeria sp. SB14A]|uniref:RDD family protein n=1 Tax=Guyparkeria sp. SB14A TaxID=2571147 RepID=UPI0010AC595D|nr:RDD family protein [Guyparkeria sp. SB14A]TKA90571.1 RDD family protein [Guyparkeria sp. SB14A]
MATCRRPVLRHAVRDRRGDPGDVHRPGLYRRRARPPGGPIQWLFRLYLLAWIAAYFVFFWCRFGQTPGMKVWRLLLIRERAGPCIGPMLARFGFGLLSLATLGLLFFITLRDPQRRSWIDDRQAMRVVQLLPNT